MITRVFDAREGGWFWVHDAIIDLYAKSIGPFALAVYVALSRTADMAGVCSPTKQGLAETCGMSVSTVTRAIRTLTNHNPPLLSISQRLDHDGQHSNIYTLLDYRANTHAREQFSDNDVCMTATAHYSANIGARI